MQETNIYSYFAFGYNYNLLRYCEASVRVQGDFESLVGRIDEFFGHLEKLRLTVTQQAASPLRKLRQRVGGMPTESLVDKALAQEVQNAIEGLDVTLDAELQMRSAFIVTPKRYDTAQLLKNPGSLLGKDVFAALSSLAQFDLAMGCRCIAFDLSTAAAFHLMRCVEGVLRSYYCGIVKRARVKRLMWFDMLQHLGKRRDTPPKALLDNLNSIRENFRNPTQHPDARYDADECQDLLAVSIDAINRLSRDATTRGFSLQVARAF